MINSSWPSILTSVPDHLPNSTVSPWSHRADDPALLIPGAWTDGDNLALLRLFLSRIGNDDATKRLVLCVNATNHDAVMQRAKLHWVQPPRCPNQRCECEVRPRRATALGRLSGLSVGAFKRGVRKILRGHLTLVRGQLIRCLSRPIGAHG